MCASHNGESIHVNTAKSMLNKLGFSIDHYECGIHAPYDKESKIALLHKKKDYSPFDNNCSGKHAGMLALAKHLDQGIKGYIQKGPPSTKRNIQPSTGINWIEEYSDRNRWLFCANSIYDFRNHCTAFPETGG